jgi:hypothetical protein
VIRVSGPAPQGAGLECVDRPTETLRCGCDDCLEAQADAKAAQDELKNEARS